MQRSYELRSRHWVSEKGALGDVATHILERSKVRCVIQAIGNRYCLEVVGEVDSCPTHGCIPCVLCASRNEASMKVELAEGQIAQPLERGKACTKIIDSQGDVVDAQLCGDLMRESE